ncbi:MAG: hypothetical protein IPP17_19390 [Bacteroidetes bacterium]|nr:hypothetical protein [Bacteroidota bacterium]
MDGICAAVAGFRRAGKGPVLVVNAGTALTRIMWMQTATIWAVPFPWDCRPLPGAT